MDNAALDRAIKTFPTQDAFAAALGVKSPSVSEWKKGRVPEDRCPTIEQLTRVTCEELLPDVDWTRDAKGTVTGYHIAIAKPSTREAA